LSPDAVIRWLAELPWQRKLLVLASLVVLIELALRHLARGSRVYRLWTAFFESIGKVWTAVILALVYLLSVGPIGLIMRLAGKDPLDRSLASRPSFWHAHEPNPLGPERAARHQF
jgi:membrane-associated protease RseP (regulator of RpoE activity)